jgi:hypothetical protein
VKKWPAGGGGGGEIYISEWRLVTWKAMIAGPVQAAQRGVPHVKYLDKVFHIPTSIDREAVTTARR